MITLQNHQLRNGLLYDFLDYKKKKPFFKRPMKIHVGHPINDTYQVVKNMVYQGEQILALNSQENPRTIVFVEATIENGQLKDISRVPEYSLNDIINLFKS